MELERESLRLLALGVDHLEKGFAGLPQTRPGLGGSPEMDQVLLDAAERLHNNFPYFHPLYAGQMLKPPHPVARAAYAMAMWVNPNNHALDGGRASSAMEREAVAELAAMFGWKTHLGHLTGGGTMANLEALWVAGRVQPDRLTVASTQAHYTHQRISGVLRQPFRTVGADPAGRMDIQALERNLDQGDVGCVVATIGTTGFGAVDPLPEILKLREKYGFRVHADCAYGGYFTLAGNLHPPARAAFDALTEVDSLVIDPHKHGLQPYGCGCVLFRDPAAGTFYKHDSPYTYFSSSEMHLGEISLECSRPGAAAVALWATQRFMPLVRAGAFAAGLEASRRAALALARELAQDPEFALVMQPELDIVVWALRSASASESSCLAHRVFAEAANRDLHLATIRVPAAAFRNLMPGFKEDTLEVVCLRSVLMKPEHEAWLPELVSRLRGAMAAARP